MYDRMQVQTSEHSMPQIPADGEVNQKRDDTNGAEAYQFCPWVRIQDQSKDVVPAQT